MAQTSNVGEKNNNDVFFSVYFSKLHFSYFNSTISIAIVIFVGEKVSNFHIKFINNKQKKKMIKLIQLLAT